MKLQWRPEMRGAEVRKGSVVHARLTGPFEARMTFRERMYVMVCKNTENNKHSESADIFSCEEL